MKTTTLITSLVMASLLIASCNGQSQEKTSDTIADVDVASFEKQMEGAQLLDVRTPEEWSQGIIEGAQMMNFYDADFDAQLKKLDAEKPVVVYCKSGGRSGQTMTKLNEMGFNVVYNLEGGIGAWNKAGKPTVQP